MMMGTIQTKGYSKKKGNWSSNFRKHNSVKAGDIRFGVTKENG